jgi:hypothetical protein
METTTEIYEWLKLSVDENGKRIFTNYAVAVIAEHEILRRKPCSCGECCATYTFDDFVEYFLELQKTVVLPTEPVHAVNDDGDNYYHWYTLVCTQTGHPPGM